MKKVDAGDAQTNLTALVGEAVASHEPIHIAAGTDNAVLIAEAEWNSIEETLYLLSVPGMRESIREGISIPIDECSDEPGW